MPILAELWGGRVGMSIKHQAHVGAQRIVLGVLLLRHRSAPALRTSYLISYSENTYLVLVYARGSRRAPGTE